MAVTSRSANGNGKSAAMLLQETSCPAIKNVQATETEESVTLRGAVTFNPTKQLAALLVEPCLGGRELVNRITIVEPVDPEEMTWWKPPIPPEVRESALKNIDEEELNAGIREIRETGGFTIDDILKDLESANKT
jgi:hypothetical protein